MLQRILRMAKPKKVLEIGTCIGYSTLLTAQCLDDDAVITTVELSKERSLTAQEYVNRSPYKDRIHCICGDGTEFIEHAEGLWDFVFLDGPKGQYGRQTRLLLPRLTTGAVIVADNVRYHDMIYTNGYLPHKHRTAIRKLREFTRLIEDESLFFTAVFENGDGLTVSRKKG